MSIHAQEFTTQIVSFCDLYQFLFVGFWAGVFGEHYEYLQKLDHSAARLVLVCSQGTKHLLSARNGAWHGTWHSQRSAVAPAWSSQSRPVCMRGDHRWRCAACFFWLRAPRTQRQMWRRRGTASRGGVQGATTLGSGSELPPALSSGPSLSGGISSRRSLVWNKNNTSSTITDHADSGGSNWKLNTKLDVVRVNVGQLVCWLTPTCPGGEVTSAGKERQSKQEYGGARGGHVKSGFPPHVLKLKNRNRWTEESRELLVPSSGALRVIKNLLLWWQPCQLASELKLRAQIS